MFSTFPKLRHDQWISMLLLAAVCLLFSGASAQYTPGSSPGVTNNEDAGSRPGMTTNAPGMTTSFVIPVLLHPGVDSRHPELDIRHPELDSGSSSEVEKTNAKDAGSRPGMTTYTSGMTTDVPNTANLTASSVYIMDVNSGAILFQKNSSDQRYPASTAKLMTALLARKIYPLDRVLTVKEAAFTTGTVVGLKLGEQLTVESLLKGLSIPSGNDAAQVLGQNHPFGYAGFVAQMNALAAQLHLESTTFHNVSGLDSDDETSTARDLALLAKEVMKDPVLKEIVGTKSVTISDTTNQVQHVLKSTNELLGIVPGVVGIKTGTTEFAGENLITQVERDGHPVIIVVLGSKDRFGETKQLIDWIFAEYQWRTITRN